LDLLGFLSILFGFSFDFLEIPLELTLISFDFLFHFEPFQGVAATPNGKFFFAPFPAGAAFNCGPGAPPTPRAQEERASTSASVRSLAPGSLAMTASAS
jgi:hypothetical protein